VGAAEAVGPNAKVLVINKAKTVKTDFKVIFLLIRRGFFFMLDSISISRS
jgi:hypothetical protein